MLYHLKIYRLPIRPTVMDFLSRKQIPQQNHRTSINFVPHFVQGGNLQKYSNGASIIIQKNVNSFYFDESSLVNQKQDTQNIVMVMADKILVRNFRQSRYDALKLYCVLNPQNAQCLFDRTRSFTYLLL
ncbi:Hypothetical_protein [Hexamita inflata]|uniref:Hypothetical_protein n=1 Tax=Hexamita inflata TaxID=28002 RepID=A0AA86TIE9_9EUKA|nr:Hypothetical protein HINF_LOCUS5851 [Hexamita inflata]